MSKIIEELFNIPEWNAITGIIKMELTDKSDDFLDNICEDELEHILWQYKIECTELVAKLLMIKIREEWRQEGQDEFDRFVKAVTKDWSEEDKERYFNQKKGA